MWWRTRSSDSDARAPERKAGAGGEARALGRRRRRGGEACGPDERELEHRVRELLRALDVRPPLSVAELCTALGRHRGRPLVVDPYPLPSGGPQGLWFETPEADVILYQSDTSPLHQDHIILHELGHILADHPSDGAVGEWAALLPGLKPEAIRRVLQRRAYDDAREREAELIATIIMEWASVLDELPLASQDPSVRRVHDALGDHQGWL